MAMYAADNIISAVKNFGKRRYASVGGIILNCRNVERETELVERLALESEVPIVGIIPRDELIQKAEIGGRTAVEMFPGSALAEVYRKLAADILTTAVIA